MKDFLKPRGPFTSTATPASGGSGLQETGGLDHVLTWAPTMEQPISEKNAIALPKLMEKFRCIRAAIIRLTFYLHTYRLHANNA
jgi:hypothetical protein